MTIAALDLRPKVGSGVHPRVGESGRGLSVPGTLRIALLLLAIGNLGRVPVLDGGKKEAVVLLNDLLVVAVVVVALITALQRRTLRLDWPGVLALVFATVGAGSALLAIPRFSLTTFQFLFSVAYLLRWVVYFGLYVAVINFVRRQDVEGLWTALEKSLLVFAGFGIFQSIFLPGFAQIVQPNAAWDRQGHRLVSSFLDPNFAGGLITIALLVVLARLASGVRVAFWKPAVLFAALLMTISRSSILAFFVGVLVLLASRGVSRRLLRVGAGMVILLLPFVPALIQFAASFNRFSTTGSAAQRIVAWLQALEMIRDHPIIGIGFNTYGFVQEYYNHADAFGGFHFFSLDGGLLFVAVMTGLVGASLYASMLWLVFRRCWSIGKEQGRSPHERGLSLGIAAATAAIVVHSVFLNSLLTTLIMEPLWVLWGLGGVLALAPERTASVREGRGPVVVAIAAGR